MNAAQIITNGTIGLVAAIAIAAVPAAGYPVQGQFTNDPTHCDNPPDVLLTHELGDPAVFPIEEQVFIDAKLTSITVCAPDDGIANDWEIRMINLGTTYWQDVHFVADEATYFALGNWDGYISDLALPGPKEAFRIDSLGTNANLVYESGASDNILEPGEAWTWYLTNFDYGAAPVFDSVGAFSWSSASGPPSNASILANPVPEPATAAVLVLGAATLLRRRRPG